MQSTTEKKPTEFIPKPLAIRAAQAAPIIAPFISNSQAVVISSGMRGEEKNHFMQLVVDLADRIDTMPSTYEQDGMGNDAMVYLHYFREDFHWFIIGKSDDSNVDQAYGYAVFNGEDQGGTLGVISIRELTYQGVDLDLYFTPRPLADIKVEKERRAA